MGKKKGASASDTTKISRDWSASAISNRDVNKLRALGFISSSEDNIRLPGAISRPRPPKGFTVMFSAFLFRGLSLPAHEFLRSLLFFYGIQLWQLTPNSILHLSIFITVCEAFLGIDPHWGLWRKIFYVKRHNDSNAPPVVGGVGFVVRKDVDYLDYPMKESVQGWRNKWFYLYPFLVVALQIFTRQVPAVAQCYPSTPESGVEPEDDDDNSEETEDPQHALEDSDVQEEEATEDDAFLRSRRRKQIHEEFITTGESSPSGQDNDAAGAASPSPAKKGPTSFFAVEDDLDPSDDDDEVPLAKRPKLSFGRKASVQEPKPSPAKSTPPSRTTVENIPMSRVIPSGDAPASSAARDHPIYATVDAMVDFAEQFTRLESENAQLRKTVKSLADQVLEANRLAANANNENILLKGELKKLKQQLKDEQDARREAAAAIDKKEGVLRESITNLLKAADTTFTRARMLREDSTADALSLATESNVQVLGLLQKAKGALSRLYSMIFPKAKQVKTLGELADVFLVDPSEPVEVLKRCNRLFGAVLTFQLLMGHGMGSELEELSKALPVDDDNHLVDL
ncbi:hypothetical protein QYE76_043391 [Lolium multiflorum]|uniref:Transposase (putative) gypsy type domain-containing protein n=1 Tax=Lolium multiflorum TaxID=4521 RepID=A0AAD8TIL9_LOLMU|nr:hypothetical protein QYE76_043391 [Lolium multiflorum]